MGTTSTTTTTRTTTSTTSSTTTTTTSSSTTSSTTITSTSTSTTRTSTTSTSTTSTTSTTTTTKTTTTITSTSTTTTPHCSTNCTWLSGKDCDPGRTYFTNKGNHNCGETTCFYRAGLCDCNNNGHWDEGETNFTCVSNNKYYEGHVDNQPQFKKPPIVCNDLCGNFNCTYTFYTQENCVSEDATMHGAWKTA